MQPPHSLETPHSLQTGQEFEDKTCFQSTALTVFPAVPALPEVGLAAVLNAWR